MDNQTAGDSAQPMSALVTEHSVPQSVSGAMISEGSRRAARHRASPLLFTMASVVAVDAIVGGAAVALVVGSDRR